MVSRMSLFSDKSTSFLCDCLQLLKTNNFPLWSDPHHPHGTSHDIGCGKLDKWGCQHGHKNSGHDTLDTTRLQSLNTRISPKAVSYLTCSTASAVWSNSPDSSYTTHSSCSGIRRSFSSKSSCMHSNVKVLTCDSHRKGSQSCTTAFRAEYSTSTTCWNEHRLEFLYTITDMAEEGEHDAYNPADIIRCQLTHIDQHTEHITAKAIWSAEMKIPEMNS